jgi:sugar phosphate isomerase/epimerase
MEYTRRDLGKLALAASGAALFGRPETLLAALQQATKPNSKFNGVQIGTITYSYRSMRDQSAEATLKYVVDSGISAIELMGGPVESFAGAPTMARGGGPGRGPGGPGGGRGPGGAPAASAEVPPGARTGSWKGVTCVIPAEEEAGRGRTGGGGGRGRGEMTAEQQAAQQEQAKKLKDWRTSVSMDPFKKLRKMYNDAGVSIYAVKNIGGNMTDEELEFTFAVNEALGATHTTIELPTGPAAAATLKRLGDWGLRKKIYVAYHSHTQGSMTVFDEAFAASKGNKANVDLGHFVAGGNKGGTPLDFMNKFHDRTASFHLKDRTLPEHCALNLPWGQGETPIKEILQLVAKNKWPIPASIEQEYAIPPGSDAVQEVRKCLEYCRAALA